MVVFRERGLRGWRIRLVMLGQADSHFENVWQLDYLFLLYLIEFTSKSPAII
jgi:hypothetical protein